MDLGLDVVLLILEQINSADFEYGIKEQTSSSSSDFGWQYWLYYLTHKTLPILRLVSRDLNGLATPIRYRTFNIKITNLDKDIAKHVVGDVRRFTRHAILSGDVPWELVAAYYDSLPCLETIR